MVTSEEIVSALKFYENAAQREVLMRFFKCGEGEYGYGDQFLGLKVPQTRAVVKEVRLDVPFSEIERLLYSRWHEVRLAGFLLLVEEMKAASKSGRGKSLVDNAVRRDEIARFYLQHARQANNWDLVDMSCPRILGPWLTLPGPDGTQISRDVLSQLAESDCLWKQRIAIVTTWYLIRAGEYDTTLLLAEKLMNHSHDLMHKAVGWMLREVGKRDLNLLRDFLDKYCTSLPRTILRYAIEKMSETERQEWLKKR